MKIIVAKTAGYCFGVKRAIKIVEDLAEKKGKNIYTYGPIIHNDSVVKLLESKCIYAINSQEEVANENLVVRSHGIGPITKNELRKRFTLFDATCPFVAKAQKTVEETYNNGYTVIILGQKNHPEIIGLMEYAGNNALIIETIEEAYDLPNLEKAALISQTTQKPELFFAVKKILEGKIKDLKIFNTICSATVERQKETEDLTKLVDIMLIVGGLHSANTNKLYEIAKNSGTATYLIEEAKDINPTWFINKEIIGITAGASTPDWIIKEVVLKVEKIFEEQMENQKDLNEINVGDIVQGKIVKISDKDILVDIGGKSEGIIPLSELSFRKFTDPKEIVSVGDNVFVKIIKIENEEGNPILSKVKADQQVAWDKLEEAKEKNSVLVGKVVEIVKSGLIIDLGIRVFVPASLIERNYVENLDEYAGKDLRVKIIELDRDKNRVIASQRAVLDEEFVLKKEQLMKNLKIGDVRTGSVKRITNFGAFISIDDGIEGLLHISELGYNKTKDVNDILQIDQKVEVKIIDLDAEKGKISLSIKELMADPWQENIKKYTEGQILQGKVVKIANFGAFVELEPGIEGLVHISQISTSRVKNVADEVKLGEIVKIKILKIDLDNHKISLSIKEAMDESPDEKEIQEEISKYSSKDDSFGINLGEMFGDLFKK